MDSDRRRRLVRDAVALAACVALGVLGLRGSRVPLLSLVDLGFHELGHLVCYVLPVGEVATAAAGSVAQVAVPVGLAAYFLVARGDSTGGAVCLAWAATSAHDVSRYVADAPYEQLPLIGGSHDWAFLLGSTVDVVDRAASLASAVTNAGWLLYAGAFAVVLAPRVRAWSTGRTPEPAAPAAPARRGGPFI